MNTTLKIAIPVVLGLIAAGLNWAVIESAKPRFDPFEGVQVVRDIAEGTPLRKGDLVKASFLADPGTLKQMAYPYRDIAALYGLTAPRDFRANDLILLRDTVVPPATLTAMSGEKAMPVSLRGIDVDPELLQVGNHVGFLIAPLEPAESVSPSPIAPLYLGPFRILSVGSRVGPEPVGGRNSRATGRSELITVAVQLVQDTLTGEQRLSENAQLLLDALGTVDQGGGRVVTMLLDPAQTQPVIADVK